jgi:hypothetical protein
MLSKIDRRKLLRASGTAAGITGLAGLTSAQEGTGSSNVDAVVDTVVQDGVKYSVCIAQNSDTGDIDGAVIPTRVDDGSAAQVPQSDIEDPEVHEISEDILREVRDSVFDSGASTSDAAIQSDSSTSQEGTDVWGVLSDAAGSTGEGYTVTSQNQSVLEDVLDEIAAGTKDSIDRIGAYYINSPKGTDCDAALNQQPHRQVGVSVEYEKVLGDFTETVLTTVLGAALGLLIGGPYGGAIGGIVGAVAGFAIKYLKDTTNITEVIRDRDACAFGQCSPSVRVLVSGIWMDEETDLLTVNGVPDLPAVHLENGALVDEGYREVIRVSS